MNFTWLSWAAEIVIALIYAVGWFCFFQTHVRLIFLRFSMRHRLRAAKRRDRPRLPWVRHIDRMLKANFQKSQDKQLFLGLLSFLFVVVFIVSIKSFSWTTALILSSMTAGFPLLFLEVRLELRRTKGSREGLALVSELHRHYWTNHKNIYAAMEATLSGGSSYPVFQKYLYRLLLRLRSTGNPLEIKEAVDLFSFTAGTVWGKMLGVCIRLSSEKGMDVSGGLQDISRQLSDAAARTQERERMNSETVRMTLFLIPLLYVGTMAIAVLYLGMDPAKLLRNQFIAPEGFLLFMVAVFLFALNLAVLELLKNQKVDY